MKYRRNFIPIIKLDSISDEMNMMDEDKKSQQTLDFNLLDIQRNIDLYGVAIVSPMYTT